MTRADAIALEIRKSAKYAAVYPGALARICADEVAKHKRDKEAVKAVKTRLHQICGAFSASLSPAAVDAAFDTFQTGDNSRELVLSLMRLHASTRERLPYLQMFYETVFSALPSPVSVLDIGCGLSPLFLSAMERPPALRAYAACDLDMRAIATVQRYFEITGITGDAFGCDVVAETPDRPADVALLLKMLPVLDAQADGRSVSLLRTLNAGFMVVTFPTRSLGGRAKGMAAHYEALYEPRFADGFSLVRKAYVGDELVYVLRREWHTEDNEQRTASE